MIDQVGKEKRMAKEYTELQLKAKEAGISNWWVKLAKTLEDELSELEAPVEEIIEKPPEDASITELMDMMAGMTWDNVLMKIKLRGKKSKFYPWKELVEKKVNG